MPALGAWISAPGSAFEQVAEPAQPMDLNTIVPLLLSGKLVAVFRGRQEFGLNKWGRRSVLGAGTNLEALRSIKAHTNSPRWMTIPTIMTDRFARHFFGDQALRADGFSSFARMSANPHCSAAARMLCGTTLLCLTQVVAADHDEWMYGLLEALAEQSGTGAAVLFASSLGNRYNSVADALGWLSKSARVSHALFDDTLVVRRANTPQHDDRITSTVAEVEAETWAEHLSSCAREMKSDATESRRATGGVQQSGLCLLLLGLSLLVCYELA
jgi:predicted NodU family carbamoyl transferase